MKRRGFLKNTAAFASVTLLPSCAWILTKNGKLRTAHIGVGGRGAGNLRNIASHPMVEVTALCDVDSEHLKAARMLFPDAKIYADYRKLYEEMGSSIDAVIVSTPDHTHAPAALSAMNMGKPVYCEKPLTHHVAEARAMRKLAADDGLVTQMGIQKRSSERYKKAVALIQSGIIGKVSHVHAWSPKNGGYDGPAPTDSDPVPATLDWNLWLGTAPQRDYKDDFYHPKSWRKMLDYGCGLLGDMGVHIFDTPYTALELDMPLTVKTICREPTGFGHPEKNVVKYKFPGTRYTSRYLQWTWYDGEGAPGEHKDLQLPDNAKLPDDEKLPLQGAMFIGETGRLLLPHGKGHTRLIVDGKYKEIDFPEVFTGDNHHHQFVDACLGKAECCAPFSYASRLTESILLGVIANRFPNKTLHWDNEAARFREPEPNLLLDTAYKDF